MYFNKTYINSLYASRMNDLPGTVDHTSKLHPDSPMRAEKEERVIPVIAAIEIAPGRPINLSVRP